MRYGAVRASAVGNFVVFREAGTSVVLLRTDVTAPTFVEVDPSKRLQPAVAGSWQLSDTREAWQLHGIFRILRHRFRANKPGIGFSALQAYTFVDAWTAGRNAALKNPRQRHAAIIIGGQTGLWPSIQNKQQHCTLHVFSRIAAYLLLPGAAIRSGWLDNIQ